MRRWLARRGGALVIAAPYLWLLILFLAPFFVVLKISVATLSTGIPPYTPLIVPAEGGGFALDLHFDNFDYLFSDDIYVFAYLNSLTNAGLTTLFCLLLGYPMAYAIARARPAFRGPLLMMIVMPFWTSFLIRVYAWIGILKQNGLIKIGRAHV